MYKVTVDINDTRCFLLAKLGDSATWHARLRHVGVETMRTMMNKKIVSGLPNMSIENETCASCLLGKQKRQNFPKETQYHTSHALELIHGDLCGPITP